MVNQNCGNIVRAQACQWRWRGRIWEAADENRFLSDAYAVLRSNLAIVGQEQSEEIPQA